MKLCEVIECTIQTISGIYLGVLQFEMGYIPTPRYTNIMLYFVLIDNFFPPGYTAIPRTSGWHIDILYPSIVGWIKYKRQTWYNFET